MFAPIWNLHHSEADFAALATLPFDEPLVRRRQFDQETPAELGQNHTIANA
jgi:hypothetical protein